MLCAIVCSRHSNRGFPGIRPPANGVPSLLGLPLQRVCGADGGGGSGGGVEVLVFGVLVVLAVLVGWLTCVYPRTFF